MELEFWNRSFTKALLPKSGIMLQKMFQKLESAQFIPNFMQNLNIWLFFENLLRPPNEANFWFHWPFAQQTPVQWIKTTKFADFFQACPGVPEAARAPKSDIIGTFLFVWRFPCKKISSNWPYFAKVANLATLSSFGENRTNWLFFFQKMNSGLLYDHIQLFMTH